MNLSDLTGTQIAWLVFALLVLGGIVVWLLERSRTRHLRKRFGDAEYERALLETGDRRRAEAHLKNRTRRVQTFHLRELSAADRARYVAAWETVQAHFVDMPAGAVGEADQLVGDLMATRGYPVADFEQRAADISVDHPIVTQNYRTAHEIALRHANGQASTEDLRRAMIHYRTLFDELLSGRTTKVDEPVPVNARVGLDPRPSLRTR